jgi:hypothetical protein
MGVHLADGRREEAGVETDEVRGSPGQKNHAEIRGRTKRPEDFAVLPEQSLTPSNAD